MSADNQSSQFGGGRRAQTPPGEKTTDAAEGRTATMTPAREAPPGARPQGATAVALTTEAGSTRIGDGVVTKIAGLAARDIPGVHSMGSGISRRVGQLRSLIPGSTEAMSQ